MSFTADVKDELTRVMPGCSHGDKAALAALARIEGTLFFSGPGRYRLEIATENEPVARLIIKSLHQIYAPKMELTVRRSVLHKTPNYLIRRAVLSREREDALHDLGILGESGLEMGHPMSTWSKSRVAKPRIFAARFSAAGSSPIRAAISISKSPWKTRRLPRGWWSWPSATSRLASCAAAILISSTSKAARPYRRFLAFVGAHQCALAMENECVRKSVRNDINRKVNAELANQAKSAEAAIDQSSASEKLAESGKMADLPPGLQEFVRLRLRYPDASLKELGERANPPLSKSAVYHRVRRLEDMARNL